MEYFALESTIELPIPLNTVDAVGSDGDAAPTFSVRKRGAASSAAATYTGTATLLSHANFNLGCYYASIPATAANGFEVNAVYDVFCFADVGDATPTGYCGSFTLGYVYTQLPSDPADASEIASSFSTVNTKLDTIDDYVDTEITALTTAVNAIGVIVTAIQAIFTGMTSLPNWLRRAFRKDAGTAGMTTAETEINTGGTSTFVGTDDNLEAIKDASGGGVGDCPTVEEIVAGIQAIPGFSVEVVSPIDENGAIEVRQGDSYLIINNRNISINITGTLPTLEDACSLNVFFGGNKVTYTGTVTVNTPNADYTLKFELTGAQTAAMPIGVFTYEAEVLFDGTTNEWTPSSGSFTVKPQIG